MRWHLSTDVFLRLSLLEEMPDWRLGGAPNKLIILHGLGSAAEISVAKEWPGVADLLTQLWDRRAKVWPSGALGTTFLWTST